MGPRDVSPTHKHTELFLMRKYKSKTRLGLQGLCHPHRGGSRVDVSQTVDAHTVKNAGTSKGT